MDLRGWNLIDADRGVLWREYGFSGNGRATTFTFRGADGLVVVSPARDLRSSEYDVLSEFGPVTALVANNAFHHLGQREWRAHFKDARSYAPARVVEKLDRKTQGLGFRPLSELALSDQARCDDAPGFRFGETIVRVATPKGTVWFTGDLLTNIGTVPNPLMRWLFSLTDSAPGLKLFRFGVPLLVKDKRAVRTWALEQLANDPPAVIVPAHGKAIETAGLAAQAKAQIERL
jgi:hypothetical protein